MMKKHIENIKNTLSTIAQKKKRRAMSIMPEPFLDVYSLLPLLLHYNHPKLPGYHESAPFGVASYQPDSLLTDKIQSEFDAVLSQKYNVLLPEILAIYSMGSTGSLGQTVDSDLDVWVCVDKHLAVSKRILLQKKCRSIEQWAKQKEINLTFFIVDETRFKNAAPRMIDGEDCGTALNMLLLEEFYLSANLLAGKLLLWYIVPTDFKISDVQYGSYDECIDALVSQKAINRDDWIDFGDIISLSPSEYFGACLWQLYKSIASPFKAVLKALVIEAYAYEYPKINSLAVQAKQLMQQNHLKYSYLDSYYMIFDKVTSYLVEIKDYKRLNLVRRCFYLKAKVKLSKETTKKTWKHRLLGDLVNKWSWKTSDIKTLDRLDGWKVGQIKEIHFLLSQVMMSCCQNIIGFCNRLQINRDISQQDISALMRKIYVSYVTLPTKVAIIPSNMYQLLPEPALVFFYHLEAKAKSYTNDENVKRIDKWHVYGDSSHSEAYEKSHSIVKLASWCYFNQLIDKNTKIYLPDNAKEQGRLRQLVADIATFFELKTAHATINDELTDLPQISQLAVVVNFENYEPYEAEATNKADIDVLNYGANSKCLITSINLLYRNSWNEIRILNFKGAFSLLDSLTTLLNLMHKNSEHQLPEIGVFCYSEPFKDEIIAKMKQVLTNAINLRLANQQEKQFIPLKMNNVIWHIYFDKFGALSYRMDTPSLFKNIFINHRTHSHFSNHLEDATAIPKEIGNMAYEGIVQIFVEKQNEQTNVYVLNEYNHVAVYSDFKGNAAEILKMINNSPIFSSKQRDGLNLFGINSPHFYQIFNKNPQEKEIIPMNFSEWYMYK